jgi:hypothetical protein
MDVRDIAGDGDHRSDAGKVVSDPPRYNLRPRKGPEEVVELGTGQDHTEIDGPDRRDGAAVVFTGVDAKISPMRSEIEIEDDRSRPRDRNELYRSDGGGRASSGSSDAGSEFSSAHGSPVGARGSQRAPLRIGTAVDAIPVAAGRRRREMTSHDGVPRFASPEPSKRRAHQVEREAPRPSHRHRSPPLFEEMSWADLEAYRKIHIAFQQQRLLASPVTKRAHELAIRPDPSLLVDKRKEVDPLRAQKSTVCGTTDSRQPGRDEVRASRVSRQVSDNNIRLI